jgi:DNA polymerase III epsilon subunit-like protein
VILVFDTETTGLALHPDADYRKQPRMIEFGGVLLDPRTGAVDTELSLLVNPDEGLTPEITKITGLTDADLVGASPFEAVLPQLAMMFNAATAVVAHNLPFDRAMIRNDLARVDCFDFPWPEQEYCTVGLHKDQWGRNPKLIELYAATMGKPLAQTHRALDDVAALVEIIVALDLHTIAFEEKVTA